MTRFSFLLACAMALLVATPVRALETDQFTVPQGPLPDIGGEIEAHVGQIISDLVADTNTRIDSHLQESRDGFPLFRQHHQLKARHLQDEEEIAARIYEEIGQGLPECTLERWVRAHEFRAANAVYELPIERSVFGASQFSRSLTLQELSPTINMFGNYLGTDKLGHFFQQGHEYFDIYRRRELRSRDVAAAVRKAVEAGLGQENGIFGSVTDGVFSNADLAANYAGFKFYFNLTHAVTIDGVIYQPILLMHDGHWEMNPKRRDNLMRPFISDHLNEAMNPCKYSRQMRPTISANIAARRDGWVAFYHMSINDVAATQKQLQTWHGEDYGYADLDHVVTLLTAGGR
ncbi:MAG TPA: hypothetical protein VIL86_02520 [Tepidisphaeraceae bacterium]